MVRVIAILLLALTAGCREEVTMLSHKELAALLAQDRQISFQRAGVKGRAQIAQDASFAVQVPRLGQDTGIWWLEEGRICSRWATFRKGQTLCAVVGQREDGSYRGYKPGPGAYLGDFTINR